MAAKVSIVLLIVVVAGLSLALINSRQPSFEDLSAREMYQEIIAKRDLAIQRAVEAGDYRCCVNPPCTMCYMAANAWNNFTPGTCACDDLIAKGEEPCPQCKVGLCTQGGEGVSCSIN